MKRFILFLLFSLEFIGVFAQQTTAPQKVRKQNKGKLFASFGWNRGYYTPSDIHFLGNDYEFILSNVKAEDRPSAFDVGLYFNPTTFTIPQTNFELGFFFHEHYTISFGIDHMKYVMIQNQQVPISGYISNSNTSYDGIYNNDPITLRPAFLTYEHTNGLNYLSIEVNRYDDLLGYVNLDNKWIELSIAEGFSAGLITPKTDATLLGFDRNDVFYLSGYGLGANVDVNVTLFQFLYAQLGLKGGFIHLPYVKTTRFKADRTSQHFWFFETVFSVGVKVKVTK